ncbi:MAG: bifunctional phosphoribosyl-AMP cyclohydrolase/phosphoribosyl-ATP diphosphatase HisIE [Firmicutes bacterium]|nr:bifunctional phosphoribosyl-AMP cyclohydrolase/phosphoribosyl-ATP diphosphatase HisIE [Bacillota bacterium]
MIRGIEDIKFDEKGLVPVIVQDYLNKRVLMMAYMNRESLIKTIETGETWFWSRSRNRLWHKGETSGNIQKVKEILYDCDGDTVLIKVEQKGAACHTGSPSCFFRCLEEKNDISRDNALSYSVMAELLSVIDSRFRERPEGSYTAKLFNGGEDRILKKIAEEAGEVLIAGKNSNRDEIVYETADLLFHLFVMLRYYGVEFEDVLNELARRRK